MNNNKTKFIINNKANPKEFSHSNEDHSSLFYGFKEEIWGTANKPFFAFIDVVVRAVADLVEPVETLAGSGYNINNY